jgi:hypothetical protein
MTPVAQRLVGRAELLKLLGVSPTRLVDLTTRPEYEFPATVADLAGGKIWDLDEVLAWAKDRNRTVHLDALLAWASENNRPIPALD